MRRILISIIILISSTSGASSEGSIKEHRLVDLLRYAAIRIPEDTIVDGPNIKLKILLFAASDRLERVDKEQRIYEPRPESPKGMKIIK